MVMRSCRSRTPPKEREPEKPKKKQNLQEACKELKANLVEKRMAVIADKRREAARPDEEEVMRMTYGPRWKDSL